MIISKNYEAAPLKTRSESTIFNQLIPPFLSVFVILIVTLIIAKIITG